MNLRSIRYFIAVADLASYSRAAEQLHISQSAISRQIQLLEDECAVKLFDRSSRGICLTVAGEELLAGGRVILQDVSAFAARAKELAGGVRGVLRIGATPQTLESFVARVLRKFKQRCSDVSVAIVEDGSAGLIQRVDAGEVDVAFVALPHASALERRPLFPIGVLAIIPPSHALYGRRSIEVADLAAEPVLLLKPSFMTRNLFDGACALAGLAPNIVLESGSPYGLASLAMEGQGIAIIPSTMRLRPNQVATRLTHEGQQLGLPISIIWDGRRYMRSLAEAFIELAEELARISYPGQHFHFGHIFGPAAPPPSRGRMHVAV